MDELKALQPFCKDNYIVVTVCFGRREISGELQAATSQGIVIIFNDRSVRIPARKIRGINHNFVINRCLGRS